MLKLVGCLLAVASIVQSLPVYRSVAIIGVDTIAFVSIYDRIVVYNTTSATVVRQSSFQVARFSLTSTFVCASFSNQTLSLLRLPDFETLLTMPLQATGSFECSETALVTAVQNATTDLFDLAAYRIPSNLSQLTTLLPHTRTSQQSLDNKDNHHRLFGTKRYQLVGLASPCSFAAGLERRDVFSNQAETDCSIPVSWTGATLRVSVGRQVAAVTVTTPSELHVLVPTGVLGLDNQTLSLSNLPPGTQVNDVQVYQDRFLLLTLVVNTTWISVHMLAPVRGHDGIRWAQVWQHQQPGAVMAAAIATDAGIVCITSPQHGTFPPGDSPWITLHSWASICASWPVVPDTTMAQSLVPVWVPKEGYTVSDQGLHTVIPIPTSATAAAISNTTPSTIVPMALPTVNMLPASISSSTFSTAAHTTTTPSATQSKVSSSPLLIVGGCAASFVLLVLLMLLARRYHGYRTAYARLQEQVSTHEVG
jgi:hypothetical protein